MINVIITDDHVILRDSLKIALEQDSDIRVIACAGNGMEAFMLCQEFQPDIVLMDIVMPEYDGIKGTRLIKEKYSQIKIIILTTFADSENIDKAIRSGADGYVLKDISSAELIAAIKNTVTNLTVIHQNVFNTLKENYLLENNESMLKKPIDIEFNEQELDIIKMVVVGKSNRDIALSLALSEGRVRNILTGILKGLKLENRTQLAIYAIQNKLV